MPNQSVASLPQVAGFRYWMTLLGIAAGLGMAILITFEVAGLPLPAVLSGNPALVMAEMALVAVLIWPAMWLAIRRLNHHHTPGWLSLPTILVAALLLMSTAFGRPFSMPVESPMMHLVPLALIVLVSACVMVEWLLVRAPTAFHADPMPSTGHLSSRHG
ncbi:MAG: hypothetical protein R3D57_14260 [Hyphomicrobiaceae bacterium]